MIHRRVPSRLAFVLALAVVSLPAAGAAEPKPVDLEDAEKAIVALIPEVEEIRGHEFRQGVPVGIMDDAGARRHVLERLDKFYGEGQLEAEQTAYILLGLLPEGTDLVEQYLEVLEEQGKEVEYSSQLNLGFYPGGPNIAPYFYRNPWPFEEEALLGQPLPDGARWHTEGWQGTILPYEELEGDPNAEARLLAYAERVFDVCVLTLMAE